MKTTLLKTILLLLMIAAVFSCKKDDEPIALANTTWYFLGIMNTETGELELEPQSGCHHCYTLVFHTDVTALGYSRWGNIILLQLEPKLVMTSATMVDYDGIDDAQLFYNGMEILTSYTVIEDELKLYYNGKKNYLLFKRDEFIYY